MTPETPPAPPGPGPASAGLEARVIAVVAAALDIPKEKIHLHSSLVDDLGTESIDFLDIEFRLESEFGIKIEQRELWAGGLGDATPERVSAHLDTLKARFPAFRWDRLPTPLRAHDLPRLIMVQTIIDYLVQRGVSDAGSP